MVPKFYMPRGQTKKVHGTSFKHLASYLLHDDGKATTQARVGWTHTLNLADDHPAAAVNEMLWTCRAADDLKREAGVKAGGRSLERPVRHFSLNWHPSQMPSKEHMIEAVESFLAHMRWHEHQALIVCHTDKPHPHVHVMLNAVHPATGVALDASFEKRRAQDWAKGYEREHGLIFCEQRLKPPEHRTPSPTRATWQQLRVYEREDDRSEQMRDETPVPDAKPSHPKTWKDREWDALKDMQKGHRLRFYAEGKQVYGHARKEVYREVREEFRGEWSDYYRDMRNGRDRHELVARKAELLLRQKKKLDDRREDVCAMLREARGEEKERLLSEQLAQRKCLRERQALEQRTTLDQLPFKVRIERDIHYESRLPPERANAVSRDMRRAADDATAPAPGRYAQQQGTVIAVPQLPRSDKPANKVRDPVDTAGGLGLGALSSLATIGERFFDGLFGGSKPSIGRKAMQENPGSFEADPAQRACNERVRSDLRESEEVAKLVQYWEERRQRTRERD